MIDRSTDRNRRKHERREAIEFFAGAIDAEADEDIGCGDDDELLTLERWCDLADLNFHLIRKIALTKIFQRSPAHRDLLGRICEKHSLNVEYVENLNTNKSNR